MKAILFLLLLAGCTVSVPATTCGLVGNKVVCVPTDTIIRK